MLATIYCRACRSFAIGGQKNLKTKKGMLHQGLKVKRLDNFSNCSERIL